jgi:catechol 2,3-dioxygenase-like lactoylglutathione lyase family enzyme
VLGDDLATTRQLKSAGLEKPARRTTVSVRTMLTRITHTFIHVLDQDQALDFYVGKLGMVVHTDADLGVMRFLTVTLPEQPELQLVLMVPGPPAYDGVTAAQARELVTKGAAGVEFTQEPTERFYGTDCALRDPFGNPIRFTQPPDAV